MIGVRCCCDTTPTHTLSPCPCAIPDSFTMTVGNPIQYENCTFQWQTAPSDINALGVVSPAFYSEVLASGVDEHRLWWSCQGGIYRCATLYTHAAQALGQIIGGGSSYGWVAGTHSNTCSPFFFPGGRNNSTNTNLELVTVSA